MATHFGAAGAPNGWSSPAGYVILLVIIGLLLPLGIVGVVTWLGKTRPDSLNIAARHSWLEPAHRTEAVRLVRGHMWWLACLMSGMALMMHALLLTAHRSVPPRLPGNLFAAVLAAFLGGMVAWIAGFYRVLRPPERPRRPKRSEAR
jgi:uncharacterized membrane protein